MRTPLVRPVVLKVSATTAAAVLAIGAAVLQAPAWGADPRPVTATQDGTVVGLTPGGPPAAVNYTIINPNRTPAYVRRVTMSIKDIAYVAAAGAGVGRTRADHPAGGPAPGCTVADFSVVAPRASPRSVPPGRTSFTRAPGHAGGLIAMVNTGRNQDDCVGTRLSLAISVR